MKRPLMRLVAGLLAIVVFAGLCPGADEPLTIPAGTTLQVRLTTTLSTRTNENGDPWTGHVVEPVFANGQEVVPVGSMVEGRVSFVKPPGRAKGVAEMRLTPEKIITPDEATFSISAGLEEAQGPAGNTVTGEEGTIKGPGKSKKGAAIEAGAAAGAGAGVGAIAEGGSGALYGAAIGAGAGLLHAIFKKRKDIVLPQGTELTFVVSRTVTAKPAPPTASAPK